MDIVIYVIFIYIYIYIHSVCGSLGKKLPKDEREGETEKLSHQGAEERKVRAVGSLCRRKTSFLGPRIGVPNLELPVSSAKSAGLFL